MNDNRILFVDLDGTIIKEDLQIEFSWQQLIFQLYAKKISLEESQILGDLNLIINKNDELEEFKLSEKYFKFLGKRTKEKNHAKRKKLRFIF